MTVIQILVILMNVLKEISIIMARMTITYTSDQENTTSTVHANNITHAHTHLGIDNTNTSGHYDDRGNKNKYGNDPTKHNDKDHKKH
jgi:hypothetical protein